MEIDAFLPLVAGQRNIAGIDYDHMVTAIVCNRRVKLVNNLIRN